MSGDTWPRAFIATEKVRHISLHTDCRWRSVCSRGPAWDFSGRTNTLLWDVEPDEHPAKWRRPVCKRCIQQTLVLAAAALDVPFRPGIQLRDAS